MNLLRVYPRKSRETPCEITCSDYLAFLETSGGERVENSKAEVLLNALFPKRFSWVPGDCEGIQISNAPSIA